MTLVAGIDPGKTGALALLDTHTGHLVAVEDMPTIGRHVNAAIIGKLLEEWKWLGCTLVVLEDVHSMPGNGHAGAFSFGRSKGVIEGAAASLNLRLMLVSPAKWKREAGLQADKTAARQLATNRWPTWADTFKRVKDDGRAEAALLAAWGARQRANERGE